MRTTWTASVRSQLGRVRRAYDRTVSQFRRGLDPWAGIPDVIRRSAGFRYLTSAGALLNSAAADIKAYLNPRPGMRFLDAGCSANLHNYHLDRWPSIYYGVDISQRLIEAMQGYARTRRLPVGGLFVAEIARLPFPNGYFHIAAVIGVLEYCPEGYIREAISELARVLKPGARIVIDIPNRNHRHVRDMAGLEKRLARPIILHSRTKVERLLGPAFRTGLIDDSQVMIKYFLQKK